MICVITFLFTEDEAENLDDYMAYLQGYDMEKYGNEHAKFKAAQKAMQKRQHEKVTKVRKIIKIGHLQCYVFLFVPQRDCCFCSLRI